MIRIILVLLLMPGVVLAQTPPGAQAQPQAPAQTPGGFMSSIPTTPGIPQADYQLGPGDSVRASVWTGNEFIEQNLTVAADGTLLIPFFVNKIINVTGLTAAGLRDRIQQEMSRIFVSPVVQVIMVGFESKKALIIGEAEPGMYPLLPNTRALDFLVQFGQYTTRANLADIQVLRPGMGTIRVNIYDIVLRGDQGQNVLMQPGDVVLVPSTENVGRKYFMLGDFRTPGVLQAQEDLNVLEAIARAGTLNTTANGKKVFVARVAASGNSEIIAVNVDDIIRKADFSQNVPLRDGDIVYAPRNSKARITDVLTTITPIISFVRDTVLLGSIFKANANVTVTTPESINTNQVQVPKP